MSLTEAVSRALVVTFAGKGICCPGQHDYWHCLELCAARRSDDRDCSAVNDCQCL